MTLGSNPSYVENLFGISHGLVPLLARVRYRRGGNVKRTDRSSQTTRFLSKHLAPLTEVSGSGEIPISDDGERNELYSMLQGWVDDRSCATSPRVLAGNLAYGSAFQVCGFFSSASARTQRASV